MSIIINYSYIDILAIKKKGKKGYQKQICNLVIDVVDDDTNTVGMTSEISLFFPIF